MANHVTIPLLAGLMISLLPAAARAQFELQRPPAEKNTITGVGHVQVRRPPSALRMHVQLTAKGKTLEDALGKLKTRREATAAQLEKLKAEKQSIHFSDPAVTPAKNAQQQRMEMMVAQRLARQGKKPLSPVMPEVTVTGVLTAQWPLEADSPEKLLLAVEAIQEKLKTLDSTAPKEIAKLSPEEQELAEEADEDDPRMVSRDLFSDDAPVLPGHPVFFYVARMSSKDREKGMADAYAKARQDAAELAKAAGVQLGPLVALAAGTRVEYDFSVPPGVEGARQIVAQAGLERRDDEVASRTPGSLAFEFSITATFAMGK